MSAALFYQLFFCAVTTAVLLFAIDTNSLFTLSTIISIQGILIIATPTFVYCNLSEQLTSQLFSIGDIFYERAWYRMPLKHQQLVIFPIRRSHMEFRLMGLGIIDCSLSVFVSVSHLLSNISIYVCKIIVARCNLTESQPHATFSSFKIIDR